MLNRFGMMNVLMYYTSVLTIYHRQSDVRINKNALSFYQRWQIKKLFKNCLNNTFVVCGVLNQGFVQEEILFTTNPDSTIALFLCLEQTLVNESIIGAFQYFNYKRYSRKALFDGIPMKYKSPNSCRARPIPVNINTNRNGNKNQIKIEIRIIRVKVRVWAERKN